MGERLEQALAEAAKIEALRYTYRVEWSPEDREYVGLVAEFPSLSSLEESPIDAMAGIIKLVEEIIEDMTASGETIPDALREVGETEIEDKGLADEIPRPAAQTYEIEALINQAAAEAEAARGQDQDAPLPAHVKVSRPNWARSRVLEVRLNLEEYDALERLAKGRGLPTSTIARARLLDMLAEQAEER